MARYSSEIVAVITATEWDAAPTVSTLRVALYGGMYGDTVNPTGTDVHYQGRIKSDVVLEKSIGVIFWNEDSDIDFGYLDIAIEDQDADTVDFAKKVTIADVDIYRVNLSDPSEDQLSLVSSSRSADIGFVSENTVRFRLESILQGGFDTPINSRYYDNTYPELDGKPCPIAWAYTVAPNQLTPTTLVDPTTLLYHVTDEALGLIDGVYDRGILLTSPSEFEMTTYGFVLKQNPDGKITSGRAAFIDPYKSGAPAILRRLAPFVRMGMTRAGIYANANTTELDALDAAINKGNVYPQFFSQDVTTLEDYMEVILSGTGAWYYVDEFSEIHFGRLTDPDVESPTMAFTDADVFGDIKVEDDKAPGLSSRISHAESPGAYDQDELAGGVSNADRVLMTNTEYVSTTTQTVIPFYAKAKTREPISLAMSYSTAVVVNGSGGGTEVKTSTQLAKAEVDRWWADLYPKRRRFYTFNVALNDPAFNTSLPAPGDFCTLQSDRFYALDTAKNLFIRRIRFNYSTNMIAIQGWG